MPAIPRSPASVVNKPDPFVSENETNPIFVPPIPSETKPFDDTTLSEFTINEREAGKEVNLYFKDRHEAELEAGRKLVEKNRRRAQFKPST